MPASLTHFNSFVSDLQTELETPLLVQELTDSAFLITHPTRDLRIIFYLHTALSRVMLSDQSVCIHLDEDLWVQKKTCIVSRIRARLGLIQKIHARKTVVARLNKNQSLRFQEENHLLAALPGKYRFGLFLDGELVSLALFSGGRKMLNQAQDYRSFELMRFCHKNNCLVVGGLSKLLKAFSVDFAASDIMTYIDKDWSDGEKFKKSGFEYVGDLEGQNFWIDPQIMNRYPANQLPKDHTSLHKITNNGSLKFVKRY